MLCASAAVDSSRALATNAESPTAAASLLAEIIVTGSRQTGIKAVDSPAPRGGGTQGCNGSAAYYQTTIGVTAITNLDVAYGTAGNLKLSVGAQNLFNKFPNKINNTILDREIAAHDNAAVSRYPIFSPYDINGGFYYMKAAYKF